MRGKYDRTVEEELRQIKENVGHLRGSSLTTSAKTLFSHKHALQCAAAFLIPFFQVRAGDCCLCCFGSVQPRCC